MEILGLTITRRKQGLLKKRLPPLQTLNQSGTWWPVIRESFTGAWQQNVEVTAGTALAMWAVYACVSLISGDIAKLCLRLMEKDSYGVWNEAANSPAFSPVLRKPNRYQTIVKFIEQWIIQKLTRGNAYALKQRDDRQVVAAMYILDASRVTPLVTTDGAVYYEIKRDDLSQVQEERIVVPASEVIHDVMTPLYHPLVGVTPIYACGIAAMQGLSISNNSQQFFQNGANPGGILTAPGAIGDETVARLLATVNAKKPGETLIGGDGLKFEKFSMSAVDSQLIEQLQWTAETVCSCFHVPPYMIGIGAPPPYANIEPLLQQYFAQAIQTLLVQLETVLDEGLGLGPQFGNKYGVEFNIDDLIWMDTATRTKAAGDAIGSGALSPNESRAKYYGYGPVKGGDSPMVQQQYYSLEALAERDADKPFAKPTPTEPTTQPANSATAQDDPEEMKATYRLSLRRKAERLRHVA